MAHYIGIAKQINEIIFAFALKKCFIAMQRLVLTKDQDKGENLHCLPISQLT